MGLQIIIKGADFSGDNLGSIDPVYRFIAAAGITNETQKDALRDLYDALVEANIWSKFLAIYPFVGGTAISHKFNLKDARDTNDAYRLSFANNTSGAHDSGGFLPDPTTSRYADTFYIPGAGAITSFHISAYNTTVPTDGSYTGVLIGGRGTGTSGAAGDFNISISRAQAGNTQGRVTSNTTNQTLNGGSSFYNTKALLTASRLTSTDVKLYNAATSIANSAISISIVGGGVKTFKIGASADASGNLANIAKEKIGFASMGQGLTSDEVASFNNAVVAFQTALGRN